jgi:hypothetical protein
VTAGKAPPVRDAIVAVRTVTRTETVITVRCGNCRLEFGAAPWNRTKRCTRCRRVCRLDLADRAPEVLPANVTPIRSPRRSA